MGLKKKALEREHTGPLYTSGSAYRMSCACSHPLYLYTTAIPSMPQRHEKITTVGKIDVS